MRQETLLDDLRDLDLTLQTSLLQRFLVEASVVDGDGRVAGKRLEQREVLIGK